jgi:serine/threonine protein kinase/tetratricopeptide (TPR) repeat protein
MWRGFGCSGQQLIDLLTHASRALHQQMSVPAKREAEIFTEALRVPVGERRAFLTRACEGDEDLFRRVEVLLNSHEQIGDFLQEAADEAVNEARIAAMADEKPVDRIGRYKLLQEIGEGGCGVVFMAEQEEPVRRRVALKIIKPGMDTKSVIARFEAERQALALMDHPSIAKVFDAGATESGRPYFVMELVRGVKITEYCDDHLLTTEQRLKLFIQVCAAIQHAHQKGIIHRDIKPSNILVTMTSEGVALPVVIDFGIAKPTTNQRLTDKTLFTAFEMFIGTPAYISPEQAALTNVDVDTRTDIYSLGVLLYELLTGSRPFDATDLLKEGIDAVRKVIREQEPLRPSTCLSKLNRADLTTVAQRRKSEAPRLIRMICGDLDWIVMKALEKDRARRYETANGLAIDVKRFLDHEAVLARPPSKFYRFRKIVQRNKLLFVGIGIIATLLVASLVAVTALLANERRARREAEVASQKAQTEATRSQQVTSFLKEMLQGVGPSVALGRDTVMLREILDRTAERVGVQMTNQPAVEGELDTLLGRLYRQVGDFDRADGLVRAGLAIRQKRFGSESLEAAASLNELGLALVSRAKLSEAEAVDAKALDIRRRLLGIEDADTATSMNDLGAVYREEGKLAEAEALAREALRIRRKLFGEEHRDVADSLRNLCIILGAQGKWFESEATARDVLSMRQKLLGPEHPEIASALGDLAWAASGLGKLDEALALNQQALALRLKLLPETHPDIALSLYAVGDRMRQRGDLNDAQSILRATLAIQRKLLGADDPAALSTLLSLALTLEAEGKWDEAETLHREAVNSWRKGAGNEDPRTLYAMRNLAIALENQHKWSEAENVHREALALWRKRRGEDDPQTIYTLYRVGVTLEGAGKWPEAEAVYRECLALWRKRGESETAVALEELAGLVRLLNLQKKFAESENILNLTLTPAFVQQASSVSVLELRVDLLGRQGRWQEAATAGAALIELQPKEHYNFHRMAPLLVFTKDHAGYVRLCQEALTKFADTANPYIAERIADDCLLLPDSGADLRLVDNLATRAVTLGKNEGAISYFLGCKALSEYRQKRSAEAVEWAEKSVKAGDPLARAKGFAVLAMARWQLGERDAARIAFAQGDELAPNHAPEALRTDLGDTWVAWLFARIQLDEASLLILSGPSPESNSSKQD